MEYRGKYLQHSEVLQAATMCNKVCFTINFYGLFNTWQMQILVHARGNTKLVFINWWSNLYCYKLKFSLSWWRLSCLFKEEGCSWTAQLSTCASNLLVLLHIPLQWDCRFQEQSLVCCHRINQTLEGERGFCSTGVAESFLYKANYSPSYRRIHRTCVTVTRHNLLPKS